MQMQHLNDERAIRDELAREFDAEWPNGCEDFTREEWIEENLRDTFRRAAAL